MVAFRKNKDEMKGKIVITFSDFEGRLPFLLRYLENINEILSKLGLPPIRIEDGKFIADPRYVILDLGDKGDHGKKGLFLQNLAIDSVLREFGFALIGNRDANLVRFLIECKDPEQIIRSAVLNEIGCWPPDDNNRKKIDGCLMFALLQMLEQHAPNVYKKLFNDETKRKAFLEDIVLLANKSADKSGNSLSNTAYSKQFLEKREEVIAALQDFANKDLEHKEIIQEYAIRWTHNFTRGAGANRDVGFDEEWNNKAEELGLTGKVPFVKRRALIKYFLYGDLKNKSLEYLKHANVAVGLGDILAVHGYLSKDSLRIPGVEQKFNNIDEWMVAINAAFQKSLNNLLTTKDEIQDCDASVLSYAARFSIREGKGLLQRLKAEYEHHLELDPNGVYAEILQKKIDNIKKVINYDNMGSTVGNNHYVDKNNEVWIVMDEEVVNLIKASGYTKVFVGDNPTNGLAKGIMIRQANGDLKPSGLALYSHDATYGKQDQVVLSSISVFDNAGASKTLMLSKLTDKDDLVLSTVDPQTGRRYGIDVNSMSMSSDLGINFKYDGSVLTTYNEGFNWFTTEASAIELHTSKKNTAYEGSGSSTTPTLSRLEAAKTATGNPTLPPTTATSNPTPPPTEALTTPTPPPTEALTTPTPPPATIEVPPPTDATVVAQPQDEVTPQREEEQRVSFEKVKKSEERLDGYEATFKEGKATQHYKEDLSESDLIANAKQGAEELCKIFEKTDDPIVITLENRAHAASLLVAEQMNKVFEKNKRKVEFEFAKGFLEAAPEVIGDRETKDIVLKLPQAFTSQYAKRNTP